MFMTKSEARIGKAKVLLTDGKMKKNGKKYSFYIAGVGPVGKREGKKALDEQRNQKIADNLASIIELQRKLG